MPKEKGPRYGEAKILLRLPHEVRRRLKVIAACENSSMNEKALNYIKKGIEEDSNNIGNLILDKD